MFLDAEYSVDWNTSPPKLYLTNSGPVTWVDIEQDTLEIGNIVCTCGHELYKRQASGWLDIPEPIQGLVEKLVTDAFTEIPDLKRDSRKVIDYISSCPECNYILPKPDEFGVMTCKSCKTEHTKESLALLEFSYEINDLVATAHKAKIPNRALVEQLLRQLLWTDVLDTNNLDDPAVWIDTIVGELPIKEDSP